MEPGDYQQVDRARELKGLGFFRIELLAEPQQDGRRQVCLLRTEIIGEDLPAAQPQRFQEPPGAVGKTRRHHGNRFRIIHPQVTGDAAAAIAGRAIGLARVQGMLGRQEMGKGPEAIARGQVRNQAFDDHAPRGRKRSATDRRREWPATPPRSGSRRPIAATAGD